LRGQAQCAMPVYGERRGSGVLRNRARIVKDTRGVGPQDKPTCEDGNRMGRRKLASPRLRSLRLSVLRVLLALGTTVLIIATTQQDTPFIVASRETFYSWLLEDEGIQRVGDKGFFYEVEDCAQAINRSLVTYYELPRDGLDSYELPRSAPVALRVERFKENPYLQFARPGNGFDAAQRAVVHSSLETMVQWYNVTSATDDWLHLVGVHDKRQQRHFFNSLVDMEFTFTLRTLHREMTHFQQFDWQLQTRYDLATRGGRIEMSVRLVGNHKHLGDALHWELIMGTMLAAICVISQLWMLQERWSLARWTKEQLLLDGPEAAPSKATSGTEEVFLWIMTMANIATVVAVGLSFGEYAGSPVARRSVAQGVMGLACLLSWGGMLQHCEYLPPPYDASWIAICKGLPIVIRFIIGSFPLFMGFACFGMSLYSEHSVKFGTLRNSLVTLFSLMNGDVLLETTNDIKRGFLGDVFLVSFVCVFAFVIMGVFLSIVQDAYASAKTRRYSETVPREGQGVRAINAESGIALMQLSLQLQMLSEKLEDCRALQEQLVAALDAADTTNAPGVGGPVDVGGLHHRSAHGVALQL
jgi:hypothetical protein